MTKSQMFTIFSIKDLTWHQQSQTVESSELNIHKIWRQHFETKQKEKKADKIWEETTDRQTDRQRVCFQYILHTEQPLQPRSPTVSIHQYLKEQVDSLLYWFAKSFQGKKENSEERKTMVLVVK